MAKTLCVYEKATNRIVAYYGISEDKTLALYPPDPATQEVLQIPNDHPAIGNQAQWKIVNGQLQEKNIVQASASAATFPADGATSVQITFTGLNASTVITVAGQQVTLSPTDNVLNLTADAPQPFTLQVNDADQWSNPVTVEAQ